MRKKKKEDKDEEAQLKRNMEPTKIDLSLIEEGKCEVKPENEGTRTLLKGFKQCNVKFHLLTDSIDKLYTKSKYKDLFDIGVLSIHSANKIDPGTNAPTETPNPEPAKSEHTDPPLPPRKTKKNQPSYSRHSCSQKNRPGYKCTH
mgnify:CR=1 FL=1